jgi:K+-sensing histidine kinase KdpD
MDSNIQKTSEQNETIRRYFTLFGLPVKYYVWAVVLISVITVIGEILTPYFDLTNIALLYLLPVLVSAVRWGRGPSLVSSFLGALTFNFFFVRRSSLSR